MMFLSTTFQWLTDNKINFICVHLRHLRIILSELTCVICGLIVFSLPLTAREAVQRFPYFGDLHVHTSWSLDSYVYFNRVGPATPTGLPGVSR